MSSSEARAIASCAAGNGPYWTFVRRELDDALEPELALDLLDRFSGLVRNQPRERGADQRRIDVAEPTTHVAGNGSELEVTTSPTISSSSVPKA